MYTYKIHAKELGEDAMTTEELLRDEETRVVISIAKDFFDVLERHPQGGMLPVKEIKKLYLGTLQHVAMTYMMDAGQNVTKQ